MPAGREDGEIHMTLDLAVSGDSIIMQQISTCEDEHFREVVDLFRDCDASHTHLETIFHDFQGPEVYPAAEAGGGWLRSPKYLADDFSWAGFDLVSHAGNHALDYSYGGLRQTWEEMDRVGIPLAGTGENLADAREPAFINTPKGRIALVSMTSSHTRWSRAGEARKDVGGRPGNNAIRIDYEVGPETMETVLDLAEQFGLWITQATPDTVFLNPPGIHNTLTRLIETDRDGVKPVAHGPDLRGNLDVISSASLQADVVIAQIHSHEHEPGSDVYQPPEFIEELSRDCIDAGADVMVCQGSHALTRGIEVYDGSPIFYDPGDLFFQTNMNTRVPADFYYRFDHEFDGHPLEATAAEGLAARNVRGPWGDTMLDPEDDDEPHSFSGDVIAPPDGIFLGPGATVPVCQIDDNYNLEAVEIHPVHWLSEPTSAAGVPRRVRGERAVEVLDSVASLSEEYDTEMKIEDSTGYVYA